MNSKGLIIAISIAIAALSFSIFNYVRMPRIAYIRNAAVVEGYLGMKDARLSYNKKLEQWQQELDTLRSGLEMNIQLYDQNKASLSNAERQQREKAIEAQQENLQSYMAAVQEKASGEEQKLTQSSFNQINAFIKEYAEGNGYDYILGTTQHGSLMYGDGAEDITENIIEALNNKYQGK